MLKTAVKSKETYTCSYCKKTFKRERTLESHACEPRRRWNGKDETSVRIAFDTFKRFYKRIQGQQEQTFDKFISSRYYTVFISFGEYCVRYDVISSTRFAEYLINNEVKVDIWASNTMYKKFLAYFLEKESVNDALTRTIEYAIKWSNKNGTNYSELFRLGDVNEICHEITTGRISPWALYLSNSGQSFLAVLEDWQHEAIWMMIDVDKWEKRFNSNKEDVEFAKNILTLGGW